MATEAEAELSPERLLERTKLLKTAEAALARLDVEVAHHALERAALIAHDGGTEIAIVRSHMQGGQYRRALAFGAHTAGAHLDEIGGAVLYAWLLHLGGQSVIAQRLLKETEARAPGDALVKQVQKQFNTGAPVASKALLALPTRLAPYGSSHGLPVNARVVGIRQFHQCRRTGAGYRHACRSAWWSCFLCRWQIDWPSFERQSWHT